MFIDRFCEYQVTLCARKVFDSIKYSNLVGAMNYRALFDDNKH